MKNFKKILAVVLALAMVLSMHVVSFAESESETLPDLVLDGGEEGASKMIAHFDAPEKRGKKTDDYKYLGWASFLNMIPDGVTVEDGNYRYLVMTYTGDITQLRFEFTRAGEAAEGAEDEKQGPFWFNPEGQTCYFVTADESEIPLIGDNTTIVIDLLNSVHPDNGIDGPGINLDYYNSGIHMHCDEMVIHGGGAGFDITEAYLTTELPTEEPETEAPTEPETEAPTEPETEAPTEPETEAPAELPEVIVLDDGDNGGFVGHTLSSDADGYAYCGYVYLKGATADYKYLQLTYTGTLLNTRFEIINDGTYWFDTWQADKFVDVDGNDIDTSYSDEERTVVIDLEKSGAELGWGDGMHIHTENLASNGGVTFVDGRLLKTYSTEEPTEPETEAPTEPETEAPTEPETEAPTEPETEAPTEPETEAPTEPETEAPAEADIVILDGGEEGGSSMIGAYLPPKEKGEYSDGYKYLGYASFLDMVTDDLTIEDGNYRYLTITYTGDITQLRFEFNRLDEEGNQELQGPFWFNPEGQDSYFVSADGTEIPLIGDNTTVVIDLLNSVHPDNGIDLPGVNLDWYNTGIHMHCDEMLTHGNGEGFTITRAFLSKEVPNLDDLPDVDPIEPETKPAETTPETKPADESAEGDKEEIKAIILDGGKDGKSGMMKKFKNDKAATYDNDGNMIDPAYKYLGYVSFLDLADKNFKYLALTYTGDITNLRTQYVHGAGTPDEEIDPTVIWFGGDQEHVYSAVDKDGNPIDIPLKGNNTTIFIDLEKSGVDIGWYNSGMHLHVNDVCDIEFTYAALLTGLPKDGEELPTDTNTTGAPEKTTAAASTNNSGNKAPSTGDAAPVVAVVVICIISALVMGTTVIVRRRRNA